MDNITLFIIDMMRTGISLLFCLFSMLIIIMITGIMLSLSLFIIIICGKEHR